MLENRSQQLESKLKEYVVLQFLPSRILMQHRPTRRKFLYREVHASDLCRRFMDTLSSRKLQPDGLVALDFYTVSDNRELAERVGLLYQYYVTDLEKELANRIRTKPRMATLADHGFSEDELLNTFTPIISTLKKVHEWGHIHGCLRSRHIVVTEEGEMKLCDAFLLGTEESDACITNTAYYAPQYGIDRETTPQMDYWALGMIMLEAAGLQSSEQFYRRHIGTIDLAALQIKIREIQHLFSDEFMVGLRLLLSTNRNIRNKGLTVLLDRSIPDGTQFQLLRPNRSRQQKERLCESQSPKKMTSYNSIMKCQRPFDQKIMQLNATPEQKPELDVSMTPTISTGKKTIQKQNEGKPEERRVKIDLLKDKFKTRLNEDSELKKKQIDKINKIIERSNAFVNELMVKKQEKAKMPSLNKTAMTPSNDCSYVVASGKGDSNNENTGKDRLGVRQEMTRKKEPSYHATITAVVSLKESPTKTRAPIPVDKLRSLSRKK